MQSHLGVAATKVNRKHTRFLQELTMTHQKSLDVSTTSDVAVDTPPTENASKRLVLYNPDTSKPGQVAVAILDATENEHTSFESFLVSNPSSRVFPSVGAFTIQCAACLKWRLIPTKEKYEEIRENILQEPFVCDRARDWRSDVSCDDPTDISQDGSRLWAIDKPNIAQPPPGWERLLRIRSEGSTRFADMYFYSCFHHTFTISWFHLSINRVDNFFSFIFCYNLPLDDCKLQQTNRTTVCILVKDTTG